MVLFSRTLRPMTFHGVPFPSSKVIDSVALALTMAFLTSIVRGYPAETAFDCDYCESIVSLFGSMFNYRRVKSCTPTSVITTMGVFSCLVNLLPEPVDAAYDVKLGTLSS
jgi:hypothetical protein